MGENSKVKDEGTLKEIEALSNYWISSFPSKDMDTLKKRNTLRTRYQTRYQEIKTNLSDERKLEELTALKNDYQLAILDSLIDNNKENKNIVSKLNGYKGIINNPFRDISLKNMHDIINKCSAPMNSITEKKEKELASLKENYNVIKETTAIIYGSYGKYRDPELASKDEKVNELLTTHTALMNEYNDKVKETKNELASIDEDNYANIEKSNIESDTYKKAIGDLEKINVQLADKLAISSGPVAMLHKRIQVLKKTINDDPVLSSVTSIPQLDASIQGIENDLHKSLKSAKILDLSASDISKAGLDNSDLTSLKGKIESAEKNFPSIINTIKNAINEAIEKQKGSPTKRRVDEIIGSLNDILNKHLKNTSIVNIFNRIKTDLQAHLKNYVNLKTVPEIKLTSTTVPAKDNKPTEDNKPMEDMLVPTETHPATKTKFVLTEETKNANDRTLINGVAETLNNNLGEQQLHDISSSPREIKLLVRDLVQSFYQFCKKTENRITSEVKKLPDLLEKMTQKFDLAVQKAKVSSQKFFKDTLENAKNFVHKKADKDSGPPPGSSP